MVAAAARRGERPGCGEGGDRGHDSKVELMKPVYLLAVKGFLVVFLFVDLTESIHNELIGEAVEVVVAFRVGRHLCDKFAFGDDRIRDVAPGDLGDLTVIGVIAETVDGLL
jgi:hypothetical protein